MVDETSRLRFLRDSTPSMTSMATTGIAAMSIRASILRFEDSQCLEVLAVEIALTREKPIIQKRVGSNVK